MHCLRPFSLCFSVKGERRKTSRKKKVECEWRALVMYFLLLLGSSGGLELGQSNCCSFSCQGAIAKRQPQARREQVLYSKCKTLFSCCHVSVFLGGRGQSFQGKIRAPFQFWRQCSSFWVCTRCGFFGGQNESKIGVQCVYIGWGRWKLAGERQTAVGYCVTESGCGAETHSGLLF